MCLTNFSVLAVTMETITVKKEQINVNKSFIVQYLQNNCQNSDIN